MPTLPLAPSIHIFFCIDAKVVVSPALVEAKRIPLGVVPYDHKTKASDLDVEKIAEVQGMRFKLFGYNTKARKNNFWCKNLTKNDGKNYLFSESEVQRLFAKG